MEIVLIEPLTEDRLAELVVTILCREGPLNMSGILSRLQWMGYMVGEKRLQRVLRSMVVNGLVERLEGRFVFGSRVYRTVYRVREDVCRRTR